MNYRVAPIVCALALTLAAARAHAAGAIDVQAFIPAVQEGASDANGPSGDTPKDMQSFQASVTSFAGRKYILGPNDLFTLTVYDAPEFTYEKVLVQPDGHIVLAPFGSINLTGMTVENLEAELASRLKYYLNDPKVSIKLERTKPFNVYVTGAVTRPGAYEMVTDINRNQMVTDSTPEVILERKSPLLSNVLVAAGGVRQNADLEHVKIVNKFDKSTFEVNLLELISGDSDQDLYLVAGDSVFVPPMATGFAQSDENYKKLAGSTVFQRNVPVKVYGYVNRPGLVQLDAAQSANLNSAIVSAGGYLNEENRSASYAPKVVLVSRVDDNGHFATRKVDPRKEDMTLRPNDVVYVPEKLIPKVGKAFDYVARIITPLAGAASGINNWALMFDPSRFINFTGR